MTNSFFTDFVTLWVVIDPVGTVPLFITASAGHPEPVQRKMALVSTAIAAGVLIAFMALGQILLGAMGISIGSFQIAGGIMLFLFAIRMALGGGEKSEATKPPPPMQAAVFPLAIPSMAGPGAILASVILTDNDRHSFFEQAHTAGVLLVVLACQLLLLVASTRIQKLLGAMGINLLSRIMGLILAAVAVENVVNGIKALLKA